MLRLRCPMRSGRRAPALREREYGPPSRGCTIIRAFPGDREPRLHDVLVVSRSCAKEVSGRQVSCTQQAK